MHKNNNNEQKNMIKNDSNKALKSSRVKQNILELLNSLTDRQVKFIFYYFTVFTSSPVLNDVKVHVKYSVLNSEQEVLLLLTQATS